MSSIKITCVLVRNTISGATPNLLDQNLHFNKTPSLPTCIIKISEDQTPNWFSRHNWGKVTRKHLAEEFTRVHVQAKFSRESQSVCVGGTEQHREKAPNRGTMWQVGLMSYQHNYSLFTSLTLKRFSRQLSGKESACNAGEVSLIPGLGSSPGGGNGSPL